MPFSLKIDNKVSPDKPPSFEAQLAAGREIMGSDLSSWIEGKTFHDGKIRTFFKKATSGGHGWHMRVSQHGPDDGTFTEFWNVLGINHAENEQQYMPELNRVTQLKVIEPGVTEIWSFHYTFSPPFSPRTFTALITCHLEAVAPRQGWIITVPVSLTSAQELKALEEKGTRGRYVSVERILELEDGTVEWRMATQSTPGGYIPSFVSERAMPKKICEDVINVINFIKRRRGDAAKKAAAAAVLPSD
ncbi:hypothetical protein FRC03_008288 [Tulasnella sp. 419]|nr:hypothetical protein FRC03_008288 [Tulasnella sp. 419]